MKGKISIDGYKFKNEIEYRRYRGILEFVKEGRLKNLTVYPEYHLIVNDIKVDTFIPTFSFYDPVKGKARVIQVISSAVSNPLLELRIKLFEALFPIQVERWS